MGEGLGNNSGQAALSGRGCSRIHTEIVAGLGPEWASLLFPLYYAVKRVEKPTYEVTCLLWADLCPPNSYGGPSSLVPQNGIVFGMVAPQQ